MANDTRWSKLASTVLERRPENNLLNAEYSLLMILQLKFWLIAIPFLRKTMDIYLLLFLLEYLHCITSSRSMHINLLHAIILLITRRIMSSEAWNLLLSFVEFLRFWLYNIMRNIHRKHRSRRDICRLRLLEHTQPESYRERMEAYRYACISRLMPHLIHFFNFFFFFSGLGWRVDGWVCYSATIGEGFYFIEYLL